MSVIWRFPVEPGVRDFFVSVPRGSRYLKCVIKDGEPQLYFKVPDPGAERGDVMFFVVPTGVELTELEERGHYVDSFTITTEDGLSTCDVYIPKDQRRSNTMVFHLFIEASNV